MAQLRESPARNNEYSGELKEGIQDARYKTDNGTDFRRVHREEAPADPSHGGETEVNQPPRPPRWRK